MAQRTIHYLFAELISREVPIRDKNRFLLGSVLPDAFADPSQRTITHFKGRLPDGRKLFDFDGFKGRFGDLMCRDDLYLGYYLHLVEDSFYRRYIYHDHPVQITDVDTLHRDYHLLNAYIVGKYGLKDTVELPENFDGESICSLAVFGAREFLAEMQQDFTESPAGSTCFLTEAMLDEFVEKYLPTAVQEARHALKGENYLRAADLAYGPAD